MRAVSGEGDIAADWLIGSYRRSGAFRLARFGWRCVEVKVALYGGVGAGWGRPPGPGALEAGTGGVELEVGRREERTALVGVKDSLWLVGQKLFIFVIVLRAFARYLCDMHHESTLLTKVHFETVKINLHILLHTVPSGKP